MMTMAEIRSLDIKWSKAIGKLIPSRRVEPWFGPTKIFGNNIDLYYTCHTRARIREIRPFVRVYHSPSVVTKMLLVGGAVIALGAIAGSAWLFANGAPWQHAIIWFSCISPVAAIGFGMAMVTLRRRFIIDIYPDHYVVRGRLTRWRKLRRCSGIGTVEISNYPATQEIPFGEAAGMAILVECGEDHEPLIYTACKNNMSSFNESIDYLRHTYNKISPQD